MKIIYSYNKKGFEADYWAKEISAASNKDCEFIPFNHDKYLDPNLYIRAQLLDNLYFEQHAGLAAMYKEILELLDKTGAEVLLVDTCPPYHPEFLLKLKNVYKVLRIADGPISAYDRDFAYLHAYDHILYHSPAYSKDLDMKEKLLYCGARRIDFWPLAAFDTLCDSSKNEFTILNNQRDIDIVFIGSLYPNKMPLLAAVKKRFKKQIKFHGLVSFKKNLYFNIMYGFPGWIRPISFDEYVSLYQRSKIGINVHNRGEYTVGSYRLFDLPANGVMQISDGGRHLESFFVQGHEVVGYNDTKDLINKIQYYLENTEERNRIALNGYKRVQSDYRFSTIMSKAYYLILQGMKTFKPWLIERSPENSRL